MDGWMDTYHFKKSSWIPTQSLILTSHRTACGLVSRPRQCFVIGYLSTSFDRVIKLILDFLYQITAVYVRAELHFTVSQHTCSTTLLAESSGNLNTPWRRTFCSFSLLQSFFRTLLHMPATKKCRQIVRHRREIRTNMEDEELEAIEGANTSNVSSSSGSRNVSHQQQSL